MTAIFPLVFSGCLSPITMHRAVIAYDHAVIQAHAEQLLLNIVRAHAHRPVHFTAVSNVAATFNFQVNAGATPPLGGLDGGFLLSPIFGGSISENPTITIVPIEGQEFTKRLLTPMNETTLISLVRQGTGIDMLLRLMAGELRSVDGEQEISFLNLPSRKGLYEEFRRRVLHLASLQQSNQLFIEPLTFDQTWIVHFSPKEALEAVEKGYHITYDPDQDVYLLRRHITGRVVITNYDPEVLLNTERVKLEEEAHTGLANDLLVDIRPGFPGGEYPLHGKFRLRSFHSILNFLARGIAEEPEYDVQKDPRTRQIPLNPAHTLHIHQTQTSPKAAALEVNYNGTHYFIQDDSTHSWNQESFRLLYQLFQMTVTEVSGVHVPRITIAK